MPFKECSLLDQREEFCRLALMPGTNMRELCRRWGVSSTAAYKWVRRFAATGAAGLADQSRRPLSSPKRTSAAMEGVRLASGPRLSPISAKVSRLATSLTAGALASSRLLFQSPASRR